ncbi:phosphonate C-P lyase system protein PhnH [Zymobacter palmae]|uniref:Uncharacterized enzyme of phosphonate metabolism n=1 Tax=Zymobacter palmae TaxID=33074 RepID=A0A348HFJ0_9GAMM|nr:phosphonate C-P lyase system protein PhnH [Zymobacter palmae]BBG30392.1 uncharacterized enzyme of phosphonate metabolism [Zymobacter palmae]
MTVAHGFSDSVIGTQHCFRRVAVAMSEPGTRVQVPDVAGTNTVSAAASAVLLTLTSHDTPLFIDPSFDDDALIQLLKLHTNPPLVTNPQEAQFALLNGREGVCDPSAFFCGTDEAPERSATLIVDVEQLTSFHELMLTGPGISTYRVISPVLPLALEGYLCSRPHAFPLGIDVIVTSGDELIAIPRTTQVEEC